MDLASKSTGERAAVLTLFAAAFAYGLQRIRLGIAMSDEGFYLAAPLRYALGDLPYRDEFLNVHRSFDVVLWPVFALFPDLSVLELRFAWLVVQSLAAFALYRALRFTAPAWLVAIACAGTIYAGNLLWSPGYHLMGTYFFVMAWSSWLTGCRGVSRGTQLGWGATAGAIFALAVLCYLPLAAVAAVPAAALVVARTTPPRLRATGAAAGMAILLALCFVGWLWAQGLAGDWLIAHESSLATSRYSASFGMKVASLVLQVLPALPLVLASALLVVGAARCCRIAAEREAHDRGRLVVLGAAAAMVFGVLLALHFFPEVLPGSDPDDQNWERGRLTGSLRNVALVLGLPLGALIAAPTLLRPESPQEREVAFALSTTFAASLLFGLLHGLLSDMAFKSVFALMPLAASSIAIAYGAFLRCAPGESGRPGATLVSAALATAIAAGAYALRDDWVFGERPLSRLNAEFQHPRLRGILSSRGRVRNTEAVAAAIVERVAPDERLLVVGNAPLLYFVTSRRPALDHSWTATGIAPEVSQRSLDKMAASGRVPTYAVSYGFPYQQNELPSPVHVHLRDHYLVEARYGSFALWRRAPTPALRQEPPGNTR